MNNKLILNLSFLVSLIATLGSLFFSEIMKYEPCKLCWEQRIFMYPIVLITLYGMLTKTFKNNGLILIMSSIGFLLSVYHYLIQHVSAFQNTSSACGLVPCTGIYINWLGFITIPFLAGTGFLILICLNVWSLKISKPDVDKND